MPRFFDATEFPLLSEVKGDSIFLVYQPSVEGSRILTPERLFWEYIVPVHGFSSLDDMADINATGAVTGDILIYNSVSMEWDLTTDISLNDIGDVNIPSHEDGKRLAFDVNNYITHETFIIGYFGETDGEMTTLKSTYPVDYVYDTRNGDAWLGGVLSGTRTLYTDYMPYTILYTQMFDKSYLLEDGKNTPFVIA